MVVMRGRWKLQETQGRGWAKLCRLEERVCGRQMTRGDSIRVEGPRDMLQALVGTKGPDSAQV